MTPAERLDRIVTVLDSESDEVEGWWWLSFTDPTLPKGSQFLGVSVVRGRGIATAMIEATRLGINPGGQILGIAMPDDLAPPGEYRERLLSRAEAETL